MLPGVCSSTPMHWPLPSLSTFLPQRSSSFSGQGKRNELLLRWFTGWHADPKTENRKGTTMSLAQRITEMEKGLLEKTDKLAAFHESKGNGKLQREDIETV